MTKPKGSTLEQCAICNKTYKNKMLYSCPKGCSVCYFCWDISIYSKNIKKCPKCMTIKNDDAPKQNPPATYKTAEYSVPYNSFAGPKLGSLSPYKKNWIESNRMTKSKQLGDESFPSRNEDSPHQSFKQEEISNSIRHENKSPTRREDKPFVLPPFKQRSHQDTISPVKLDIAPRGKIPIKQPNNALSYSGESSMQCQICYNYFKESSFFFCPNACSVCYQCWANHLVEKKTSDCPKCSVFLPDSMRFKLELTTNKYLSLIHI